MTKERELLRRALEDWDFSDKVETLDPIFEEIRTYLSTSDDAEEPVYQLSIDVAERRVWLDVDAEIYEAETQCAKRILHPPNPVESEANCYGDGNVYRGVRSKDSEVKTVYVKTAEPARKPMTPKERSDGYMELEGILGPDAHLMSFLSGICAAEKHHGITDADV